MIRKDYINKFEEIIKDGIRKEAYESTTDTKFDDIGKFQSFLRGNFEKYKHYNKMKRVRNQPARLYDTAEHISLII